MLAASTQPRLAGAPGGRYFSWRGCRVKLWRRCRLCARRDVKEGAKRQHAVRTTLAAAQLSRRPGSCNLGTQPEHGRSRAQVGALFAAASALKPAAAATPAAEGAEAEAAAADAAPADTPAAAAAGFEPPLLSLAASLELLVSIAALMAAGDAEQVA